VSVIWAAVPAAGLGTRMAADRPKQYLSLAGRTVIEHALSALLEHPRIEGAVVALRADDRYFPSLPIAGDARLRQVAGGEERAHSVFNALNALLETASRDDWVLVHDAARPCLSRVDLDRLIEDCLSSGEGGILAAPVRDTMKRDDGTGHIASTVPRTGLWHALTPQMFRLGELHEALARALDAELSITDEASALEQMGRKVRLVAGAPDNLKITHPEDLRYAEAWLAEHGVA
jgi:2-C-methyl-D-erythritol 4-phosphate cytidylyltransferase